MTLAEEARSAALPFPGGFPAERQRQLEHLEKMAALVRGSEPDPELERLYQDGDAEGVVEHLRRKSRKTGKAD
jgi:ketosteroid isomerase-like protein